MDPDVRALVVVVRELVQKVDGLICHYTSIDADYTRVKTTLHDHEERLQRIERDHNFEPAKKIGETSALFPAVKLPEPPQKSMI